MDNTTENGAPTRRDCLRYGGVIVTSGLLAGCTGDSGEPTPEPADTETPDSAGDTPTDTPTERTPTDGGAYTVEMAPVGEIQFEQPPEQAVHYFPDYADMAVALGHGESIASVGLPSRFHTDHYAELDGVRVETDELTKLVGDNGIDKELFYELDGDVHVIDPEWLINNGAFALAEDDIEEISKNVAPFIGNTIFRRTDGWHDYRHYTMYEAFEKVAKLYQEEERFEQLTQFHDELIAEIQTDLPPADSRPNALLTFAAGDQPEAFFPYRVSDQGTNKKQFHDLGITDALADTGIEGLSTTDRGQIDYETMLEVDPDSILVRGHEGKSRAEFEETVLAFMKDHGTASALTAVQNDMVFRGGPIYSGPLHHLFLTERYANLFFSDVYEDSLFDRDRLAAIVREGG